MKFLRTASTGRLLAALTGTVIAIVAGAAIAVAATSGGPVPRARPLASAVHQAITAAPITGITADINFTNNLISSVDFTGGPTDPILQGATGRLWLSNDHRLRLELQSSNGDSQLVVDHNRYWISDPSSQTVYEGTLPADSSSSSAKSGQSTDAVPTIAQIQAQITKLMGNADIAGAQTSNPTDVAGRPAYSVSISPKHAGGLLGSAQVAWDAVTGVPLNVAVYARGNSTPVLQLKASNISYGPVPASDFALTPPSGYKVVTISGAQQQSTARKALRGAHAKHADVSGVAAVRGSVPFSLVAPKTLVGLPRGGAKPLDRGGTPAALVTYGQGAGAIAVIEQKGASGATPASSSSSGKLSLPTVSINGATGQELDTPLGTVLRFTRGGVSYTLIGSVTPYAADQAARALAP
jgi:outer membrane lipoprotein-sorting protein